MKPQRVRSPMRRANPATLVALALLVIGLGYAAFRLRDTAFIDLNVYRAGGTALIEGSVLYQEGVRTTLPFTYPPFAAILFVPFALLPLALAQWTWTFLSIVTLALSAWLIAAELPSLARRALPWSTLQAACAITGVGLLFEPVLTTLDYGQVNLVLMWFVLFDSVKARRFSGVLTGLAAAIKIVPAIFVAFMLLTKRYRAFVVATVTFLVTMALGFVLIRGQAWLYWTKLVFDESRVGGPEYVGNQSLNGALLRLGGPGVPKLIWIALCVIVLGVGAWTAWRIWPRNRLLALTTVGLVALLVSPISWSHHWVWFVPLTACMFATAYGCRTAAPKLAHTTGWIAAVTAAVAVGGPLWWGPATSASATPVVSQLLANSYVIVGVLCLACLAWIAKRRDIVFATQPPTRSTLVTSAQRV